MILILSTSLFSQSIIDHSDGYTKIALMYSLNDNLKVENAIEWFNKIKFTKWNTVGEGVILFSMGIFLSMLLKIEVQNLNMSIILIFAIVFLLTLLIVKKINIV